MWHKDYPNQRKGRGTIGCPTTTATAYLRWKTIVRELGAFGCLVESYDFPRADDKKAADLNIVAGSVLHLVLALRGGR